MRPVIAPNSTAALRHKQNSQRVAMFGTKTVPSPVPRPFVQYPWNSWTYEANFVTATASQVFKVTVAELTADIQDKLSLDAVNNLKIKVQSSQVWCIASGLVYPSLQADFYELNGGSSNAASIRSTQADRGTLNMPAKAGYKYPVSDAKDVLNADDAALNIVAAAAVDVGSNLTFRVQFLWQIRPVVSFLAFASTEGKGPQDD